MLPDQRSAECAPAVGKEYLVYMRRRCRCLEVLLFRKEECRGLKSRRAEGGAAEADGKDVLGEWW